MITASVAKSAGLALSGATIFYTSDGTDRAKAVAAENKRATLARSAQAPRLIIETAVIEINTSVKLRFIFPHSAIVAASQYAGVEVWGRGQGPNFRPDMNGRKPDIVDEAFRQYAINWGLPRVARLFHELKVPLSLAVNAQFPEQHLSVWTNVDAI
jgi:hypothetical protein